MQRYSTILVFLVSLLFVGCKPPQEIKLYQTPNQAETAILNESLKLIIHPAYGHHVEIIEGTENDALAALESGKADAYLSFKGQTTSALSDFGSAIDGEAVGSKVVTQALKDKAPEVAEMIERLRVSRLKLYAALDLYQTLAGQKNQVHDAALKFLDKNRSQWSKWINDMGTFEYTNQALKDIYAQHPDFKTGLEEK